MSQQLPNRIVWVDLEMTGLDLDRDHILEMACIVTDGNLNVIEEGPDIVIHQPKEILDNMNEWCVEQHGKSGLTKAVQESKVSLGEAEELMLKFVETHCPKGKCPLGGNSVHCDKKFLDKYMERFIDHLHYRIIDVSTVKELCRRWYPDLMSINTKDGSHRALQDIKESIEELKYYRKAIFKQM